MSHILHLDASARSQRSITRQLTSAFVAQWLDWQPDAVVTHRDVGSHPPPMVSQSWIAAAFAGEARTDEQRELLSVSDTLIDEVVAADLVLIGTPMYNYGMPAALKAWFDQIIRVDRTFTFDLARGDQPLEPVLDGKQVVVMTSSGEFGFGAGELNAAHDHLVPHIRSCARYLGAETFEHLAVEYQEFGDERHDASMRAAFDALPTLVKQLQDFASRHEKVA
ncbi:MAG: NAD(P)H-dependent oxidoreductase [Pseudomonadaceae bacterium]|nr:NAD(P)H-dependent oxidoreductase [Pseudomonadaceae bacterium]